MLSLTINYSPFFFFIHVHVHVHVSRQHVTQNIFTVKVNLSENILPYSPAVRPHRRIGRTPDFGRAKKKKKNGGKKKKKNGEKKKKNGEKKKKVKKMGGGVYFTWNIFSFVCSLCVYNSKLFSYHFTGHSFSNLADFTK